ncbi:MAG: hypothetical protein CK425_10395 [Parachlamydia sp.]|nr:MAG: hypothetical protein CK425_10395 [Parachlamydia sp.]
MFAVIYRGYVKTGCEAYYLECWTTVASYFVEECGALGSTLHKTDEGMWIAYSKWPDKATRDALWSSGKGEANAKLPLHVQEAINGLKLCLEEEKLLPEICMEVLEEIAPRRF